MGLSFFAERAEHKTANRYGFELPKGAFKSYKDKPEVFLSKTFGSAALPEETIEGENIVGILNHTSAILGFDIDLSLPKNAGALESVRAYQKYFDTHEEDWRNNRLNSNLKQQIQSLG